MTLYYLVSFNIRATHILCSCASVFVEPRTNTSLIPSYTYTDSKYVQFHLKCRYQNFYWPVNEVLLGLRLTSRSVNYRRQNNTYCVRTKSLLRATNGRFIVEEAESTLFLNNTEVKNRKSYSPSSDLELDISRFNIFKVHTFGLTSRSLCVAQSRCHVSIKQDWVGSRTSDMPREAIYSACMKLTCDGKFGRFHIIN